MSQFVLLVLTVAAGSGLDWPEVEYPAVAETPSVCRMRQFGCPVGLPVTKMAKDIVPALIEWDWSEQRLPGQTPKDESKDQNALWRPIDLKTYPVDVIYIAWHVDGRRISTFQWKYETATGEVKPLTVADCRRLARLHETGKLSSYETAYFGRYGLQDLKSGSIDVQFRIGLSMAGFVFQKNEQGKYVAKKELGRGAF